jgi:hypothetical protein
MLPQDQGGLTPGAHLRAEIKRLGLDQVRIAEATGVSRQTINCEKASLTAQLRDLDAPFGRNPGIAMAGAVFGTGIERPCCQIVRGEDRRDPGRTLPSPSS